MTKNHRDGLILILLASAGYAVMPTLVKTIYANSTFEPMDIALWRFIFAVPLIWSLIWMRGHRSPSVTKREKLPIRNIMVMGVLLALAALAAFFGIERLPASIFVVLFYTYPAMVVVISFFMGEKIGRMAWIALLMALCGVALTVPDITSVGGGDVIGVGFAFANAVLVAIYYLMSNRVMAGINDIFRSSAFLMIGTLIVLCFLIPIRGIQIPDNLPTWLSLLVLAAFSTVLPVFTVNLGIQKIGASQAALVSTSEPVMSMSVAMLLLGEIILPVQWVGAAFIVGSVILLQLRPSRKTKVNIATDMT